MSYKKSTSSSNTSDYVEVLTAFGRTEFHGLTKDEIDLLAKYAFFIKSRRKAN